MFGEAEKTFVQVRIITNVTAPTYSFLYCRKFSSERRTSKETVLNTIHSRHISRTFILKMLSNHIYHKSAVDAEVQWYDGVVVESTQISSAAYDLESNLAPFLFHVLSHYWPYDQSAVYICDNLFESIAVWFYLLRTRYNDLLFGRDLSQFSSFILGQQPQEQQQQRPKARRGIRNVVI